MLNDEPSKRNFYEATGKGEPRKKDSPVQSCRSLNRGNHFHVHSIYPRGDSFRKQRERQFLKFNDLFRVKPKSSPLYGAGGKLGWGEGRSG